MSSPSDCRPVHCQISTESVNTGKSLFFYAIKFKAVSCVAMDNWHPILRAILNTKVVIIYKMLRTRSVPAM